MYCEIGPASTAQDVFGAITTAIEASSEITEHEDLVRALADRAPLELALDCDDVPEETGLAAILRLIDDLPEDVSLLIACRSRSAFNVGRYVSRGTAALCDAERLSFDAAGIRHLAETCSVPFTHADVLRMLEVTDGWPQVVSGALRKAAEDSRSLSEAFENWRVRHGHLFNEFVATTLRYAPER
ncbi:MAG: hypothetical protein WA814_01555, partial [Candidatus Baltobacteraceae bacterium]